LTILLAAPQIYDSTLALGPGPHLVADLAFLISISGLIAILVVGVLGRWRWMFWLIVIAFLFGAVRVIASALQLMNVLPPAGPAWYSTLQGAIGVVQLLIALAMISGYRKGGTWGDF